MSKKKVLLLVEGDKKEQRLLNKLFQIYDAETSVEIVSYSTNIYALYNPLFKDAEEEQIDLFMLLRSREKNKARKKIFDEHFNEVILIFDFDPQDSQYSNEKLDRLMRYFNNSTTHGRLFINYPMVESLFHISSWNESQDVFNNHYIEKGNLLSYKSIVDKESCRYTDFKKFTRQQFDVLMKLNLLKVLFLLNVSPSGGLLCDAEKLYQIFQIESHALKEQEIVYVLNTCILYFYEYKPSFFDFFDNQDEL